MSSRIRPYITSLRLRTLPLSVSGIILGTGLAWSGQVTDISGRQWGVFALAICTTLCLQILSNLSNELGDARKGTDADQQGREAYGMQAGTITEQQMKRMIGLFIGLSVVFGTALVLTAFSSQPSAVSRQHSVFRILVFLGLGLLAIIGAMTYTLGRHNYGYKGLGDLGVFLFFGLLSTLGAYYLQAQSLTWEVLACGAAIGLPCVGVLNLNNIRDMANDLRHGKRTFAGQLGETGARIYQTVLLATCLAVLAATGRWWTLCVTPLWGWHLWYVWTHTDRLDKQMPVLMFSTLVVAVLALI